MIKTTIGAYNMIGKTMGEQILSFTNEGKNVLLENMHGSQIVLLKGDKDSGEDNSLWISFKEGRSRPTIYTTLNDFLADSKIAEVIGTVKNIEFT